MRTLLACTLAMICSCRPADDKKADEKKADEKIDAKKLVGEWESKEKGASGVVEFTKDGKVTSVGTENGKEMKAEGTYRLDGNTLTVEMKFGDKEKKRIWTISKLTDTELVSSVEGGEKETLIRVKEKAKDKK